MKLSALVPFVLAVASACQHARPTAEIKDDYRDKPTASGKLAVFAAVSLKDALEELAPAFESDSGQTITFTFGASGALEQQIEHGAPASVFIAASAKSAAALEAAALAVPASKTVIAHNRMVLVAAPDSDVRDFADLAKPEVKAVAIGDAATVPAGQYAVQVLTNLKLLDAVKPKLKLGADAAQTIKLVESGAAEAGIVYATDALDSQEVKVVAKAATSLHDPVKYPAVVVKGPQEDAAAGFVKYLRGGEAKAVFARRGFLD